MIITVAASFFYMWYAQVPNPFGSRGIRGLLMLRAAGGFFGVFGMYFSLLYMPLSEATVLTFLSPIVACYACSFLRPKKCCSRSKLFNRAFASSASFASKAALWLSVSLIRCLRKRVFGFGAFTEGLILNLAYTF